MVIWYTVKHMSKGHLGCNENWSPLRGGLCSEAYEGKLWQTRSNAWPKWSLPTLRSLVRGGGGGSPHMFYRSMFPTSHQQDLLIHWIAMESGAFTKPKSYVSTDFFSISSRWGFAKVIWFFVSKKKTIPIQWPEPRGQHPEPKFSVFVSDAWIHWQ